MKIDGGTVPSCSFSPAGRRWLGPAHAAAVTALIALSGCATKSDPLPPPPPRADLCIEYTSWLMSPAAAAVETIGNLRSHASNQAAHHEKCVIPEHESKLDPARPAGPR